MGSHRTFTTDEAAKWTPGDPIYTEKSYAYIFNWRDDQHGPEPGGDAATWPRPSNSYDLDRVIGDGYGVEAFIANERAARNNGPQGAVA